MPLRGVRGAVTARKNTAEEILERTQEMLEVLVKENQISVEDVASAIFSVTDDLNAEFPAVAARKLGWMQTPLFCTREIPVTGSLQSCIRVLLHVNSEKDQADMHHVYLYEAKRLRPDFED